MNARRWIPLVVVVAVGHLFLFFVMAALTKAPGSEYRSARDAHITLNHECREVWAAFALEPERVVDSGRRELEELISESIGIDRDLEGWGDLVVNEPDVAECVVRRGGSKWKVTLRMKPDRNHQTVLVESFE